MATNLRTFFAGSEWTEVTIPPWFKERGEALIEKLGDEHVDVQLFKEILAAGEITENAVANADALAATTANSEVFVLAIDIASHAFTVFQAITQVAPLIERKAA